MVIYATLNIIAFIPITISGLGIKESAAVFFYSLINVTPSITLNVHIILLLIHYFIAFLTIIFLLSYSQTQDLLGNSFN